MFQFIRREKIYMLMFVFILAVSMFNARAPEEKIEPEKKSLSTMTFEEMGISEDKVKSFLESDRPSAKFFRYGIALGFFIFLLALVLNLAFILGWRVPMRKAIPTFGSVPWGIPDLLKAGITIIFIGYIISIMEGVLIKLMNINTGLNMRMIINTFFIDMAVALIILYFVAVKYKERLHALGLRCGSFLRDVFLGIITYILIVPILLVILFLSMIVLNRLGYTPPPQPVFEVFIEEERSKMLLFLTVFVSIFGPIVEEIFFRGFMYSAIRKSFGVVIAVVLSASIFSILHTNIVGFLPIMTLGVILAYLYETTGSLVASVTVHMIHNSIIVGFVFFIKELMA